MQFQVPIQIKPLDIPVTYKDNIMLTGSCFTEHIGNYLQEVKFHVLQNPNGILFEPLGVCNSLVSYIEQKRYTEADLFYLNEAWHSWQHHSRFSAVTKEAALRQINQSQEAANAFLKKADWLIITLGSSFVYKLVDGTPLATQGNGYNVVNCHKAPAQTFNKHLSTIEEIVTAFDSTIHRLFHFNPSLKIMFTISPVRHIRDGVQENNRSKARLIEAVHHLVNKFSRLYYFPAYELVIDVLRDYRFYDIDMAHPNYAATQFVLEKFTESCMHQDTARLSADIRKLVIAKNHKPFNPASVQHKQFLQSQLEKTMLLATQYPYLDFTDELAYFAKG
ncbi:GSCFA domain-containing protein [Foetidibacter luteolus]|uniref:GSCFA domain-containing protein n=1 Tax=Foetidibacter luteolus TaxID=2608880 RepID=UPI00129A51D1|nr:GSCFA domain-containing protein [Foetidibacter luteolus]